MEQTGKMPNKCNQCSIICLLWGFIEMYILQIGSQKFICKVSEAFVKKSHLRISPGPWQYSGASVNLETVYLYLVYSGGFYCCLLWQFRQIPMDKIGQCYCGNIRGKWVDYFLWLHKIGQCLMGCGHIGECCASQAGATFGRWEMALPGGQEGWNGWRTNLRYLHFALHELNMLMSLYAFSRVVYDNDIILTIKRLIHSLLCL